MDQSQLYASVDFAIVLDVQLCVELFDVYYGLIQLDVVHLLQLAGHLLDGGFVDGLTLAPELLVAGGATE